MAGRRSSTARLPNGPAHDKATRGSAAGRAEVVEAAVAGVQIAYWCRAMWSACMGDEPAPPPPEVDRQVRPGQLQAIVPVKHGRSSLSSYR